MFIRTLTLVTLLLPAVASANLQIDSHFNCTGDLTVSGGVSLPSAIACVGSLSFSGSLLSSDTDLFVTATDNLTFKDVTVTAPFISLSAGGTLDIDASSLLTAERVNLTAGTIVAAGQITTVPEPTTWALIATGLVAIGLRRTVSKA